MNDSPSDRQLWKSDSRSGETPPTPTDAKRVTKVSLILVQVKDDDVVEASALISKAVDGIHSAGGTVFHIVSAIVIGTFDFGHEDRTDAEKRCEAAAHSLQRTLGTGCKIMYGVSDATYGNFGTPTRIQYGPFIRRISDLFAHLQSLDFGAFEKLK
jgi:hypothetical protein